MPDTLPDPLEGLARRVATAAASEGAVRTLLLDLDGTLAPIAPTPDAAAVPAEVLATLERLIEGNWRIAVVSGRSAAEVAHMVPVAGVKIFGSHGLEGNWDDGPVDPLPENERVERLTAAGRDLARGTPGTLVERKPAGVAFHDRQVPDCELDAWHEKLDRWLATQDLSGFERLDGRRVVELRPRGADKGRVVRAMWLPAYCDESLVALGDDATDEDMFRELLDHGMTVCVGPAEHATTAAVRLNGPDDVQRFLTRLAELS